MNSWYDALIEDGARIVDNQVVHFGIPENELNAAQNQQCLKSPRLDMGAILLQGGKIQPFLQGQMTCDIQVGTPAFGALCTPQGKVVTLAHLMFQGDDALLLLPKNLVEKTIEFLAPFAALARVQCTNYTAEITVMDWLDPAHTAFPIPEGTSLIYTTTLNAASAGYMRIAASPEQMDSLWDAITAIPTGYDAFHWALMQQQLPELEATTSEQFFPHDLGLEKIPHAISFKKGCYCGQEVIAKMEHRGQLKRGLHRVTLQEPAKPGAAIFRGQTPVGQVLYSVTPPGQPTEALTVLKHQATDNNETELLLIPN